MPNSHLGQPIYNHVVIGCYGTVQGDSSVTWTFYRILPDGTVKGFTIPKGTLLVVTDVDWNYNSGDKNKLQIFRIMMKVPKKEMRNAIFASTALGDADGSGGVSVAMTTGIIISNLNRVEFNLESGGSLNDIVLRGYVINVPDVKRRNAKINSTKRS